MRWLIHLETMKPFFSSWEDLACHAISFVVKVMYISPTSWNFMTTITTPKFDPKFSNSSIIYSYYFTLFCKDKSLANFRTSGCIIRWAYVLSYFVVRLSLCSACMSWMFPCLQHVSEKFVQNLLHSGALSTNLSMNLQNQIKWSDWCCAPMWFLCYPTEINCNLGKRISN